MTAGGGGFVLANVPGYTIDYSGVEVSLVKRLSQRWMGRVGFSYNDSREHFSSIDGMYDTNGNPTRTVNEPLVDGGQHAPQASVGTYLNAKWQFSANGMYQAWHGIELAASVFGRQGYPFPIYRSATLGADTLNVLVSPEVDSFRLDNLWTTDLRVGRVVPHPAGEPARGRRPVQRVQRQHRARPRQQHRRVELQCAQRKT